MKRVWLTLAMLLGSGSIFADTSATSARDLSMKYLGQIFGDVPGALNGSGSGLIGGLFGVFDKGVMAVAAIWLMYTITQVLITTATSDGPQKSIKNWALWLRICFGFGLLIPGPSGYCLAQELMMQVVVQSVNLANKTWDYALNYMQDGNALFVSSDATGGIPAMSASDVAEQLKSFLGGSGSSPLSSSVAYQLFNDEVCMYASNTYNQKNASASNPIAENGSKVTYQMIPVQPIVNSSNALVANSGAVYFPGYGDTSVTVPTETSQGTIDIPSHACGSISMPSGVPQNIAQYQNAFTAIQQAAIDMAPYAKQVADQVYPSGSGSSSSSNSEGVGAQYLFNSMMDYLQLVQPVANNIAKQSTSDKSDFVAAAEQQGWFNAGGFYWDLVRWNDAMNSSMGNPLGLVPTMGQTGSLTQEITSAMATATASLGQGPWLGAQNQFVAYSTGKTSNNANNQSVNGTTTMIVDMGIITAPLHGLVMKLSTELQSADRYNPMLISYQVGKQSLTAAGTMWAIFIPVFTVLSIAAGICTSVSPGNVMFNSIISWMQPLVITASGFLFTTGCMLTFYVPLYPYLLFLFGVVGWLLCVVEAMVAAPLVAFGMSHPEGHDFMGRAEQALMLALGVFLRPALMIVGYLVGTILVYVTSGFLNTVLGQVFLSTWGQQYTPANSAGNGLDGIWTVMAGSVNNSDFGHFTGNAISDTMVIPVILTIYAMIMIEVVNQCFSAIHQVPSMVLRWIGGPVEQDQSAQHVQAIKGAAMGASQQGGQAMGQIGKGASDGFGGIGRDGGKLGADKAKANKKGGDDKPSADPAGAGGNVSGS